MFEVLKLLRDLNALRPIAWEIEGDEMVVRIPISAEDAQFVNDMQRLFEPTE